MAPIEGAEMRLLVHAPRGRDAAVVQSVLANQGLATQVCADTREMMEGLREGAAGVILTEEALPDLLGDRRIVLDSSARQILFAYRHRLDGLKRRARLPQAVRRGAGAAPDHPERHRQRTAPTRVPARR